MNAKIGDSMESAYEIQRMFWVEELPANSLGGKEGDTVGPPAKEVSC